MKTRLMMKLAQKSVNTQLLRSALKMRTKTLKMKATVKSWVEISRTADPVNNNLENVVTKVYLHYSYMNLRDAEYPVKMILKEHLHAQKVLISEQKKKLLLIDRKQQKRKLSLSQR